MTEGDDYLELAKNWLRRQPVQSPDALERYRNDAALVVEAYEIISALVNDPDISAVRQVGENIRFLEQKVQSRDAEIAELKGTTKRPAECACNEWHNSAVRLIEVGETLSEAGIDLGRYSTLDGLKHLIAIKAETERENDYLASLVMECQKALGAIVSRVGGHESHDWVVDEFGRDHWRCCRICGTVERRDKANKPCKGPTRMRPMETS